MLLMESIWKGKSLGLNSIVVSKEKTQEYNRWIRMPENVGNERTNAWFNVSDNDISLLSCIKLIISFYEQYRSYSGKLGLER
jgi:hypothetical protein